MSKYQLLLFAACLSCHPALANAGEITDWLSIDTYLRARASTALTGGSSGMLANTTLLGRLMNESSKIQIDAEAKPLTNVLGHVRLEGETLRGADTGGGSLGAMSLTQTYVQFDNVLTDGLSFRVGSADYLMGVMQYYDLKPGRVLLETYGLRADYTLGQLTLTAAVGDSGYIRRKDNYEPIITEAVAIAYRVDNVTINAAAEVYSEIAGPEEKSEAAGHTGYKIVAGVKYASDGILKRSDTYLNLTRDLPNQDGTGKNRHSLTAGEELQLGINDRFEIGLGTMASYKFLSNEAGVKSEDNVFQISPLIRAQGLITQDILILTESAFHVVRSINGNLWNDKNYWLAWQGKAGLIISPEGIGILKRPHLRLLYGAMYVSDSDLKIGNKSGKSWKHTIAAEFEIKF